MELDTTDVKILRALQEDARLSFRALARRIGVSVPTISARVSNLLHLGVITGFHASIDPGRFKKAPGAPRGLKESRRVVIADGTSLAVDCFECGQSIDGVPVRIRMDGRTHYLCCTSCEQLYRERYERIRSLARTRLTPGPRRRKN